MDAFIGELTQQQVSYIQLRMYQVDCPVTAFVHIATQGLLLGKAKSEAIILRMRQNTIVFFGPAVAVYQAVFKAIQKHRKLYLPDAVLKFDSYKEDELIASAKVLDITDVTYACEDKQFPPTLLVYKDSFQLQIVLNFNLFYEAPDIEALKSHAYEKIYRF